MPGADGAVVAILRRVIFRERENAEIRLHIAQRGSQVHQLHIVECLTVLEHGHGGCDVIADALIVVGHGFVQHEIAVLLQHTDDGFVVERERQLAVRADRGTLHTGRVDGCHNGIIPCDRTEAVVCVVFSVPVQIGCDHFRVPCQLIEGP